jgi:hypothetical protein
MLFILVKEITEMIIDGLDESTALPTQPGGWSSQGIRYNFVPANRSKTNQRRIDNNNHQDSR